jgi:type I restriction enzyme R subunit
MSRNEAQTRFELIDPALEAQGCLRSDIRIEETAAPVDIVYGKGQRRAKGRTDYVLRRPLEPGTEPIPLAIIEARREDLPPQHGLQQGKNCPVGQSLEAARKSPCGLPPGRLVSSHLRA